jgi:hypothetical protein
MFLFTRIKDVTTRTAAVAATALLIALTLALSVSSANAAFGVAGFDGEVVHVDGTAASQAGGHPHEASTRIEFNQVSPDPLTAFLRADGTVRRTLVELPAGLVGNPTAVPTCSSRQVSSDAGCPLTSQVGMAEVLQPFGEAEVAVYNMVPPRGAAAAFVFVVAGVRINLYATLRTGGDYGITIDVRDIPQALPVLATTVRLWGVPGDHRTGAPRIPFLTNPSACTPAGRGLLTRLTATSWEGATDTASFVSHDAPPNEDQPLGPTGCDVVPFEPSFAATPSTSAPDSPTGLDVNLSFPTDGLLNPEGIATAALKTAKVTLPEGMTINPAGAGGLAACTDAQLNLEGDAAVTCPSASKVGSATATTPLLRESLTGAIYIRSQNSSDPESGEMFRIALVLENEERGISIRLPGSIRADKNSGRLVTTFDNNPQLPVGSIDLEFKGGPRAPLATPLTCGQKTVDAELTSWSGKTVARQSTFNIDCTRALGEFTPSFAAGTVNPAGGAFSPFALTFGKPDGNKAVAGITLRLPEGLTANIADHLGTQVGSVTALAGPGTAPYALPGAVFFEGAYGDAPFSLRAVVPAVAGPFNLGVVEVRQKVYVDPHDAHVTVVSDPLPTIVAGVPVRLQRLDVNVDKPGFILNPTSCAPKVISGTLAAEDGQTAAVSSRFQVGDCGSLRFVPKMTLKVGARGKLTRGKRTPLEVTLTMPRGDANNKSVTVTLPKVLNSRLDVVNRSRACSIDQFNADRCPMVVGNATAVTPLLRDPLKGPAYFVYNPARRLPDLVVRLRGQVAIDLVGKVAITRDLRLQTNFDAVPDAPITKFRLLLESGPRNGPIGITRNLCLPATRRALKADLALTAQSARKVTRAQQISVAGCGRASARGRRAARSRRSAGGR